jgi:UDP-N-acetylglucosamine--N-acetylmuramyl-(pentapeptide) pyrophosphoryl-undecaprenol N-acetylglucosamine transferase
MPQVLAAAELVLGRSGAGTVWEAAAAGKPMVLIPLRGTGTRGDQVENAGVFEKAGAAAVIGGKDRGLKETAAVLTRTITELAENPELRNAMAAASGRIGNRDGAELIARIILTAVTGEI